ncbi:MAG: diguanylate cyclase [Oryzomonas sp.]|jgi:diguanylate cyclase (GGDEF)-like protein
MEIPPYEQPAVTLLYAEDDNLTQELVIQILRSKFPQITLLLAQNGQHGLDLFAENRPDIVVTDIHMPIINGIQMAKKIRELDNDAQIIILSAADEVNNILQAIDIGINHYVLKPVSLEKFIAAVERCLDKISLREQLKQRDEYIRRMAYYDNLTGLPNRQLFSELLHKAVANAQRQKRLLSVSFLDLDGFKNINDTLGHLVGDQLLKGVADRLRLCCGRDQDTVARWGGDEFVILLPDLEGPEEAVIVAQKIIAAFDQPVILPDRELAITVSIGVSLFPDDGDNGDALIKNADFAMFCAKNKGRNQFHLSATPCDSSKCH